MDAMVDVDLYAVGQAIGQLKLASIEELITKVINLYGKLKDKRDVFINKLDKGLQTIDNFLNTQLTTKV